MPHLRSQSNRSSAFSSSPVDLGPRSRGRSWTLLLNRLGPAGEIIGQPRPSSHLRTLAGDRQRPYGSSAEVWSVYGAQRSQPVATGSKCDGREDGYGKEGVDGSSPSEGLPKSPANGPMLLPVSTKSDASRVRDGYILGLAGTRDQARHMRGHDRDL